MKNCFTYSHNMHTVLPRRLPEEVFCFHFFRFFHNKAEKIDNVILEIIMPYVQASEALS